jgi:hypothetical protein
VLSEQVIHDGFAQDIDNLGIRTIFGEFVNQHDNAWIHPALGVRQVILQDKILVSPEGDEGLRPAYAHNTQITRPATDLRRYKTLAR